MKSLYSDRKWFNNNLIIIIINLYLYYIYKNKNSNFVKSIYKYEPILDSCNVLDNRTLYNAK